MRRIGCIAALLAVTLLLAGCGKPAQPVKATSTVAPTAPVPPAAPAKNDSAEKPAGGAVKEAVGANATDSTAPAAKAGPADPKVVVGAVGKALFKGFTGSAGDKKASQAPAFQP